MSLCEQQKEKGTMTKKYIIKEIKFQVAASGTADIYVGELGIRCEGSVSVSAPDSNGSVTLMLG